MLVKFKQAVHLKGKAAKGKDYSRGVHEVCEEHLADPYFHKLITAGLVEDAEAAKVVAPLSLHERQQKLAEKLAASPRALVSALKGELTVPAPSDAGDAGYERASPASPEGDAEPDAEAKAEEPKAEEESAPAESAEPDAEAKAEEPKADASSKKNKQKR